MLSFLFGLALGFGGTVFVAVIFGLCAASKRADEEADYLKKCEAIPDRPARKETVVMVRGDESVVN